MSPGGIFDLNITAKDENGNFKNALYAYYTPNNLPVSASSSSIIYVHLNHTKNNSALRFAAVKKSTDRVQKTSLVLQNSEELESKCTINYNNSQPLNLLMKFSLHLIDLSDGQVVCQNML